MKKQVIPILTSRDICLVFANQSDIVFTILLPKSFKSLHYSLSNPKFENRKQMNEDFRDLSNKECEHIYKETVNFCAAAPATYCFGALAG